MMGWRREPGSVAARVPCHGTIVVVRVSWAGWFLSELRFVSGFGFFCFGPWFGRSVRLGFGFVERSLGRVEARWRWAWRRSSQWRRSNWATRWRTLRGFAFERRFVDATGLIGVPSRIFERRAHGSEPIGGPALEWPARRSA